MRAFSLVTIVLLAGCASAGVGGAPDGIPNLLRPGDELLIRVWPDTTLSGRFPVEANGGAYLPMIGAVDASFRTAEEIRSELISRYSEVMREPVIVVTPRFRVSLLGEVQAPGLVFADPSTTLMDLLVEAGGFTQSANPSQIRLIRRGEVFRVDAKTALEDGAPTAAIPLQSGDRIVVPRRGGFNFYAFAQFTVQLATLTVTVINLAKLRRGPRLP